MITILISFLTFNIIAKQLKIAKSNIIHAIVKGVPVENAASSSDDMMPLPYCKAPMSAAAEPTMLEGTASRAAALVHDAIMPFILNITNTKPTIANMPPHPVTADRKRPIPPKMAVTVEQRSSLSSEYRVTSWRLNSPMVETPIIFTPKRSP